MTDVLDTDICSVEVLPLTSEAAAEAGAVRMELEAGGTPIGAYDFLIAGHVRSLGATLVTNNLREFSRVSVDGRVFGTLDHAHQFHSVYNTSIDPTAGFKGPGITSIN